MKLGIIYFSFIPLYLGLKKQKTKPEGEGVIISFATSSPSSSHSTLFWIPMDPFTSSSMAQKTWELENDIVTMETPPSSSSSNSNNNNSNTTDTIFYYDEAAQAKFQQEKPWVNDPHFFKRVKISALALLKMVVHARSGGTIEVMGLMQGKTDGDAIIVMDAFALPVEGTETRVNAQADAYEYMVDYSQTNKQVNYFTFF